MISCQPKQKTHLERIHEIAVPFCIKFNNCTQANYRVCMSSIEDKVKAGTMFTEEDAEMEIEKFRQFYLNSTCKDLWLLVYTYHGTK